MFVAVFAFMFATTFAAELPSYINVCGRRNPRISRCILNNVNNLRDKICHGFAELDIPPFEPFNVDKIVISEVNDNKIYLNDIQITGMCNYDISFEADIDKLNFVMDLSLERLQLNGTYDVAVRLLVAINKKAPVYFTTDKVRVNINIQATKTIKNGKEYIYASEVKTKIVIEDYEVQYGVDDEKKSSQLNLVVSSIIGNNRKEFIESITPPLEEAISNFTISIFNSVTKRYTFDELYPDRE